MTYMEAVNHLATKKAVIAVYARFRVRPGFIHEPKDLQQQAALEIWKLGEARLAVISSGLLYTVVKRRLIDYERITNVLNRQDQKRVAAGEAEELTIHSLNHSPAGGSEWIKLIPDVDRRSQYDEVLAQECWTILKNMHMRERDRSITIQYLMGWLTLKQIGVMYGVVESRASQIVKNTLHRVKMLANMNTSTLA